MRYQHATTERDTAIADGIDRILEAAKDHPENRVVQFRQVGGDEK